MFLFEMSQISNIVYNLLEKKLTSCLLNHVLRKMRYIIIFKNTRRRNYIDISFNAEISCKLSKKLFDKYLKNRGYMKYIGKYFLVWKDLIPITGCQLLGDQPFFSGNEKQTL